MSMARRLFGTDGVRGAVGDVLTPELAWRLGRAAASLADAPRPRALIVRDTRESGPVLEATLAVGCAAHPDVGVAVASEEAGLLGRGRVLVRPSGTEPLVRVMAEAPSTQEAEAVCRRLADVVAACA